jgi:hypothetical protein
MGSSAIFTTGMVFGHAEIKSTLIIQISILIKAVEQLTFSNEINRV